MQIDQATANAVLAQFLDAAPICLTNAWWADYLRNFCVKGKGVPSQVYDTARNAYVDAHPEISGVVPGWDDPDTKEERLAADQTGLLQSIFMNDTSGNVTAAIMADKGGTLQAILTVNFGDAELRGVIAGDSLGVVGNVLATMPLNSPEVGQILNVHGYTNLSELPSPASVEEMRVVQGFVPVPDGFKVHGGHVVPA